MVSFGEELYRRWSVRYREEILDAGVAAAEALQR
jgi:hypothetical protein